MDFFGFGVGIIDNKVIKIIIINIINIFNIFKINICYYIFF